MNTTHTHTHTHSLNHMHSQNNNNKSTCERTERVAKNTQEYLWVVALKKSFGPRAPLKWELHDLLSETQHTILRLPVSGLPTVHINPVYCSRATRCSTQLAQHKKGQSVSRNTDILKNAPLRINKEIYFWSPYHTHFCTTHNPLTVLQKLIQ